MIVYYASTLFDPKIIYIILYKLCLFLLAYPCVFATPRDLWLLPRWDDNAWLRVDEWSADGNQRCRQVSNKLGYTKKCDTLIVQWLIRYHKQLWNHPFLNDLERWKCQSRMTKIFGNIERTCRQFNSQMQQWHACFCGCIGCEVANKFTAEQLLVCVGAKDARTSQRVIFRTIAVKICSATRSSRMVWSSSEKNAWQRMKVERFQCHNFCI